MTITNTGIAVISITKLKLSGSKSVADAPSTASIFPMMLSLEEKSRIEFRQLYADSFKPALLSLDWIEPEKQFGDVNGDGIFDVNDITDIQRYITSLYDGTVDGEIADTDCNG